MSTTFFATIKMRRGLAASWTLVNPVLADGEYGVETDTGQFKIGDGIADWNALPYAGGGGVGPQGPPGPPYSITASRGSPTLVTSLGGIAAPGVQRVMEFIAGSGGPVIVVANPQIGAGTIIGQELLLVGTSDSNYVILDDGMGLNLNGAIQLGATSAGVCLSLVWDGTNWVEVSRR